MKHFFIVSLSILTLMVACSSKPKDERPEVKQEVKMVPEMKLTAMDGTQYNAKSLVGKKLIFILFQPDCEHCQNESRQIEKNISKFAGYELYFISSASLQDIEKFSNDYKLKGLSNVHFAKTEVQSIIDSFGPIPAPSVYLYSEKGEQRNSFNGEVAIEVIIKYL